MKRRKMKRRKQHKNEDTGSHDHNNQRENEENKDKLSELPDCLLIHILSFLKAKEAVQTCILSSRWEHIWKHLTALTLKPSDFRTVEGFMDFVKGILSRRRDNSKLLNALDFECPAHVETHVLERIVRYVASHDVDRLRLSYYQSGCFPSSLLLSCHSLTSLDIGSQNSSFYRDKFPNSMNLPALAYLKLHKFSFYAGSDGRVEPFSTFNRLNTLMLYGCYVENPQQRLCISSTTLLNLSIYSDFQFSNIELFAPNLCTFAFTGGPLQKLSGSHFSSIEQVSIDVYEVMHLKTNLDLLNWLIEMTNIKSLTVTLRTLLALSKVPDILMLKLTCLCNLKSLNLKLDSYGFYVMSWRDVKLELANDKSWKENVKLQETIKAGLKARYSSILDGMIEFLLQNSPSAKVDILLES